MSYTKPENIKIETFNNLYNLMRREPDHLHALMHYISDGKWKVRSHKIKDNKITFHLQDGDVSKPLYFDSSLNIYEDGKKASKEAQANLSSRIEQFIISYFKGE